MTNYQLVNYGTATKATSFANFPVDAWVHVMGDKRYKQNELYARVPWVYAAADLVASAVMTVPTYFVRGDTEWKNGDEDAPPVDWFNDWSIMAYRIVFSALNYGAGYANNEPLDFRWLATPSITEEMDGATGRLKGFRRQVGSKQSPLIQPEDIVHFWWFKDPMTEIGRAKIYPAKVALGAGDALNAYTILLSRYADSGAVGVKLLQSPQPANPDEAQELKTRWSRIVEGVSKAFGSIVLNPDAKVMTLSDKLSEFYDHAVIQDARRDVEAAFGLPETMLNQAANLATKQADQVDFYTNVVAPICDWLATTVNRQAPRALRGYRLIYRVNEVQAMQRDENEVADSLMKYVAAGYTPEVASDLLGIDLTDEQRAALRETQTAPEEIILERTALGGVSRRENLDVTQGQAARALEVGQLERWVQNRLKRGKSVDPDDFTAETLTADEVKAIVERETGAAEDSPFLKASLIPDDEARNKIERQLTTAVYKVLRDMPAAVIGDNYLGWEQRLNEQRAALRSALETPLRSAVLLGTASGRQYVEKALGNQKSELSFNWGLVNDAAISWLLTDAEGFGTGYVDVLTNQLLENTADKIRTEIAAWIQNQEPLSALIDTLVNDYMFDRSRAEAVAQTEVTRAYAWGNRAAWRGSGVVSGMQWVTANDERVCPVCAPLGGLKFGENEAIPADIDEQKRRGLKVGLDEPFVHPGGRGAAEKFKGETFDLPPAHPRCRCSVVPLI